ncbi:CAAX protease self-immunity [Saccharopolyspora antimicrobica]|uniref:CAAX prenyl protease-like protein n=1 Tax=Saccharopolyspora antimicrobica TaxID=455193 RepID=A0A1I4T7H8_9PSEU|nr:CPBP family intramembrane glutamic endopeptidase [Saccharopolyspora antimicrobica]RKT85829.1 CAAX prenyl protease-like protein [Saccharopolyspora antimicrobica]SFM72656.1 CAAX protease self-immunity [Saccharopolyspora antimicrobica]
MNRRDLWVFLAVALGGAWLIAAPLWLGLTSSFVLIASAMMFTPALGVLAVRLLDRRTPAREWARETGLTFGPRPKRTVVLLLAAWFGTVLFSALAVAVSAALGLLALDLEEFSLLAATVGDLGAPVGVGSVVAIQLVAMVLIAPLINSVLAFGEEWGWRGWLLPRLAERGVWPALLISGVIWGVWHAPLTLLGYNYANLGPWAALVFTGTCVLLGILLGWLRLRSGSVWPAVLAHGAINASGGLPMLLGSAAAPPNLVIVGMTGMVGWVLMALLAAVLLRRWPVAERSEPVAVA